MWQTSERNVQERSSNLTQNDDYWSYKVFKKGNWNACIRLCNCVILHVGFLIHQISKHLWPFACFCCSHSDKWTFIFLCFYFRYLLLMLACTETAVSVTLYFTQLSCLVCVKLRIIDAITKSSLSTLLFFLARLKQQDISKHFHDQRRKTDKTTPSYSTTCQLYSKATGKFVQVIKRTVNANGSDESDAGKWM